MAIAGNLEEFSLPEIFQFLETQQGTGLLSIHAASECETQKKRESYLWLHEGRIVAFANTLDNQGLTCLISQRGWLKPEEIHGVAKSCLISGDSSLGVCLKKKEALSSQQLSLLFYVQVLLPVCALFKMQTGQFVFDSMAVMPTVEMTGMSLSATKATLLGLRVLRDWTFLADKLPHPNLVLTKTGYSKPYLKLDSCEGQVWKLASGKISLDAIAHQLQLPLKTVQQIVFRLQMVGLVEEVSNIAPVLTVPLAETRALQQVVSAKEASGNSFVQSFIGLFQNRKPVQDTTNANQSSAVLYRLQKFA